MRRDYLPAELEPLLRHPNFGHSPDAPGPTRQPPRPAPTRDAQPRAARRIAPLRVVVDHCAKPNLREGSLSGWRVGLERLAELPNVVCKLSGLVTEAARADRDALAPAVEHALATFGEDRLLFGSDWPVCTLAASYDRVLELVHETLGARITPDFERKLFGGNARGFNRL
jgi:L-fuconolactonase